MTPPLPHDSSLELAQRLSAHAAVGVVTKVRSLSPSLREITISHDSVVQLAGEPGHDVMIRLRSDGERYLRRRYSVRSVDPTKHELHLWVSHAHSGVGSKWSETVAVGDEVDLIGPRGKIVLDPIAQWHLFVGDTCSLGAFYRLAESVRPPGRVTFIVEVETIDDAHRALLAEGVVASAIFVERQGRRYGDPTGLLSGLSAFSVPQDEGHAYLFGEYSTLGVVQTALLDRGLESGQISFKAFWRTGRVNAEHGEPPKDA